MALTQIAFFVSSFVMVNAMVMAMVTGDMLFWYLTAAMVVGQFGAGIYRVFTAEDSSLELIWMGSTVFVAIMAWVVWGGPYLRGKEAERLYAEGVATPAVVLMVEDTGNRYNSVPEVLTHLEVRPEGAASYRTTYRHVGYPLPVGTLITVYVDPEDPGNVAVK